jgi:hypothetical protein
VNEKSICNKPNISELKLEAQIMDLVISKIRFDVKTLELFYFAIQKLIKQYDEEKHSNEENIEEAIKSCESRQKETMSKLNLTTNATIFKALEEEYGKLENEITRLKEKREKTEIVTEEKKNDLKEYLYYAKSIADDFPSFPRYKKKYWAQAMFEYIVCKDNKIIDFRLKLLFSLVFDRQKVLTMAEKEPRLKKKFELYR